MSFLLQKGKSRQMTVRKESVMSRVETIKGLNAKIEELRNQLEERMAVNDDYDDVIMSQAWGNLERCERSLLNYAFYPSGGEWVIKIIAERMRDHNRIFYGMLSVMSS